MSVFEISLSYKYHWNNPNTCREPEIIQYCERYYGSLVTPTDVRLSYARLWPIIVVDRCVLSVALVGLLEKVLTHIRLNISRHFNEALRQQVLPF